jgi:hypothetical protein
MIGSKTNQIMVGGHMGNVNSETHSIDKFRSSKSKQTRILKDII